MTTTPAQPRPGVRVVLSALILIHVSAVFVGPWALPPTSDLATSCFRLLQPYMQVAFLDNGYRFFAPEPGPSHLIRYEVLQKDGHRLSGTFPDRDIERPRLLYHRYFMLSEFLNSTQEFAELPGGRERLEACARLYARHLARQFDAKEVTLFLYERGLPTIFQVRDGMKLTDPAMYKLKENGKFGPYRGDEL